MRVREISYRPNLLRGIDGAVLSRLGDRDRPRLHVMLVSDVMQMLADSGDGDLSMWRCNREQLASDVLLGRAALRGVDVRGLRADHSLVRLHHALETEHVSGCPAENQKHLGILAEQRADTLFSFARIWIGAVRRNMASVHFGQRRQDFGMHTRPIAAPEGRSG